MISTLVPYAEFINNGNPQYCTITATTLSGNTLTLTEANLRQGGFRYDARTISGEVLEVGSAIAAQLTLSPFDDGYMGGFDWYGATLNVQIGIECEGTVVYGNLGQFVVDEADRRYDVWTITALDNLVRFDKEVTADDWEDINASNTLSSLISLVCGVCGVSVGSLNNLLNDLQLLPKVTPRENVTYRNILQWCGELGGVCFYCDGIGRLCCDWYSLPVAQTDANVIALDKRYKADVSYSDVELTGVIVTMTTEDGEIDYVSPALSTDENNRYRLHIQDNPFFVSQTQNKVNNIGTRLDGFVYAPFTASTVPFLYLAPLDGCYIAEVNGINLPTIITHVAFSLNGECTIEATGKSIQSNSYANGSAFTRQQAVIIDTVKEQLSQYINRRTLAIRDLNNLMANAMGLQFEERGGKWYFYNAVGNGSIENATIIYTFVDNGFAWAAGENAWNGGNPVWNYGITVEGNAYLNQINATGITVAKETSDYVTEIAPELWRLSYKTKPLITASGATGEGILRLDKVQMTDNGYIRMGKARMYGTSTGMDIVIED